MGIVLSSQQLFEVEKVSDKVLFLKNGVPTHLSDANNASETKNTFIEIDIQGERTALQLALSAFQIVKLEFNGGLYVLEIEGAEKSQEILSALVENKLQVKYFRDISSSTRRLFQ